MFYEGPQGRAYLAAMRQAGYQPEKILVLNFSQNLTSKKEMGTFLPSIFKGWFVEGCGKSINNYWPKRIFVSKQSLVKKMIEGLNFLQLNPSQLVSEMVGPFNYDEYCPHILRLTIRNYHDVKLYDTLKRIDAGPILFTGGGILPSSIFTLTHLKYLHIHPGTLPFVRGADGLLWSILTRGKPGMSAFFMEEGIDTGQILKTKDYPKIQFDISSINRPNDFILYQALYSFCDPILRASFLVHELIKSNLLKSPNPKPQDVSKGITFHFMHDRLKKLILEKIYLS